MPRPKSARQPARPTAKKTRVRRVPRAVRQPQMLQIAAKVFGRHGYEATSMNDVAKACGISKPMLYAYFGSKEGLYASIIGHAGVFIVQEMASLAAERDPTARLHKAAAILMSFVDHYRDSWQMVFAESREMPSIHAYRKHILAATTMTLAQFRPPMMPREQARKLAEPYAHIFMGGSEAAAQWWVSTPGATQEQVLALSREMITNLIAVVKRKLQASARSATDKPRSRRQLPARELLSGEEVS